MSAECAPNGGHGRFLVKTDNRVEIEGEEKPAMNADWLVMLVVED